MRSYLQILSGLQPRVRRTVIMVQDVLMVLIAVALSLVLSRSDLSFDPLSLIGLTVWAIVILLSHVIFRYCSLYNTVWRFASTPDFFNILKGCAIVTVVLYVLSIFLRHFKPVTGLNERQFIVFFLVAFTIISAPRLFYRFLREGASWRILSGRSLQNVGKHALFVGRLAEADMIIRFMRTDTPREYEVVGIMSIDPDMPLGTRIQDVPIVAVHPALTEILEEYTRGTKSIDLLIFGSGAEKKQEFAELVRVARQNDITVTQFAGFSQIGAGGKLVLDAVKMETILRRTTVPSDVERIGGYVRGKRVMVTGGAGSIGRILVKRLLELGAELVIVADLSEFGIFRLNDDLADEDSDRLKCRIVDVRDRRQMAHLLGEFRPHIVFHAAALKHVPLLEENWMSGIQTNVFGTLACAELAAEFAVPQFVLISSDKAVDPSSVLGATKRAAEQIISSMHRSHTLTQNGRGIGTKFNSVRFGNVFASDGSVAAVFQKQIEAGGPVTITDRRMTRYFMTISEAVDLVIMSAADAETRTGQDDCGVYMLDMGDAVPILEVAETMIRMAGKTPYTDIPIRFTGIRPGEKLHEVLRGDNEELITLGISKVFGLKTIVTGLDEVMLSLEALRAALDDEDKDAAIVALKMFDPPRRAAEARIEIRLP